MTQCNDDFGDENDFDSIDIFGFPCKAGYLDARGADMGELSFQEALHAVRDLSLDALPDVKQPHVLPGMKEAYAYGEAAIDTVDRLLACCFLNGLPPSKEAGNWPEQAILPPSIAGNPWCASDAVRIVLAMARSAARDPWTVDGIEDADDIDIEQANLDMVADLLGMHADTLLVWNPQASTIQEKTPPAP